MVDAIIALTIISVAIAAAIPVVTKTKQEKTKIDKHVLSCLKDGSFNFYNDGTGVTNTPSSTSICYPTIKSVMHSRGHAFRSIMWKAKHGSGPEKVKAEKILRTACDDGGSKACDYFINKCITEGGTSDPYCDLSYDDKDLTYYLKQPAASEQWSVGYIQQELEEILPNLSPGIIGTVSKACTDFPNSMACELDKPWIYIKACNLGLAEGCTTAFDNNYNKSCTQISTAWPEAPTDIYKLTYKGAATPTDGECTFMSAAAAAITGCNAIADTDFAYNCSTSSPDVTDQCSNDCFLAYSNNYNRSCNQVRDMWPAAPYGIYNLTDNGAPPAGPTPTDCAAPSPACEDQVGNVCPDGTIYAGMYGGKHLYTTPTDQGSFVFSSAVYPGPYFTAYTGFGPYYNSPNDGEYNQHVLLTYWNQNRAVRFGEIFEAPFIAVEQCEALNTASHLGHNDWYLPAKNELIALIMPNSDDIGGFDDTASYWSSTKHQTSSVVSVWTDGRTVTDHSHKYNSKKVRCIRKEGDYVYTGPEMVVDPAPIVDCSTGVQKPGDVCSGSGQVYVGEYSGRKLYTTNDEGFASVPFNDDAETGIYYPYAYRDFSPLNFIRGEINTYFLTNISNGDYYWGLIGGAPFQAPQACADLVAHGYDDWYLPSITELLAIDENYAYIGHFYTAGYWSSNPPNNMWGNMYDPSEYQYYNIGSGQPDEWEWLKLYTEKRVRCIRDDSTDLNLADYIPPVKPNVDCTDATADPIGSPCNDGTTFAATYNGYKYFIPSGATDNVHQLHNSAWNNGTGNWTTTGATSDIDGAANTAILAALSDGGSPYAAAVFCDNLAHGGYNDWFLPAKIELMLIGMNKPQVGWMRDIFGNNGNRPGYWTSTEYDNNEAWTYRTFKDVGIVYEKKNRSTVKQVLCTRKVAI